MESKLLKCEGGKYYKFNFFRIKFQQSYHVGDMNKTVTNLTFPLLIAYMITEVGQKARMNRLTHFMNKVTLDM